MSEKSQSESSEKAPQRYIIVGIGGIGSWLAEGLARMVEYRNPGSALLLVDGDNFEPKNVERQSTPDLNGNKAEVVAEHLMPLFQNTYIVPMNAWVVADDSEMADADTDEDADEDDTMCIRASDLLEENDIVYAVVDNFKARSDLVEAASKLDNVDVFLGGNDEALYGDIYHYRRRAGVDLTRNPKERSADLADPQDRNPGEMSCQERAEIEGGTQLIATNLTVAALLLGRTQHTIIEDNDLSVSQIYFDLGMGQAKPFDRTVKQKASEETKLEKTVV